MASSPASRLAMSGGSWTICGSSVPSLTLTADAVKVGLSLLRLGGVESRQVSERGAVLGYELSHRPVTTTHGGVDGLGEGVAGPLERLARVVGLSCFEICCHAARPTPLW
jgi:hypothetical protein